MSFLQRLHTALDHRRFPVFLAVVAFVVHAPSLGAGYLVDDHTHRYFAQGQRIPGGPRGPWDLYRFADAGPGVREAIDTGLHPWWTAPTLKLAFFRPIASLLRVAEEKLFAEHAFFPHLVSCLLFVVTTLAVHAALKRWLSSQTTAALGAFLFAIDDAHASTVTWIAARHSLLATCAAALGTALFLRARDERRVSFGAGGLVLLALFSSEAAVSVLGFVAAITLFDDSRPSRERARGLAPIGIATLVWLGFYVALHDGSSGSAYYVDPVGEPLRFVGALATRLPALFLAQLFVPPSELSSMQPALAGGIAALGYGAMALTFLLAWKTKERARALGLLAAFVLALVPACGTNSDDRLLLLPGIPAMGLVALACRAAYHASLAPTSPTIPSSDSASRAALAALATMGVVHVGLALVLLPLRSSFFASTMATFVDRGAEELFSIPEVDQKDMLVVTCPDGLLPSSMLVSRKLAKKPVFRSGRLLVTAPAGEVSLTRLDDRTISLRATAGMMNDPFVGAVRAEPFRQGDRITLPDVTVTVAEVTDRRPTRIVFAFRQSLDRQDLVLMRWSGGRFESFTLPAPGASMTLPPIDFATALARKP